MYISFWQILWSIPWRTSLVSPKVAVMQCRLSSPNTDATSSARNSTNRWLGKSDAFNLGRQCAPCCLQMRRPAHVISWSAQLWCGRMAQVMSPKKKRQAGWASCANAIGVMYIICLRATVISLTFRFLVQVFLHPHSLWHRAMLSSACDVRCASGKKLCMPTPSASLNGY